MKPIVPIVEPNTSGDSDKSKSTTPSEFKCVASDPSRSLNTASCVNYIDMCESGNRIPAYPWYTFPCSAETKHNNTVLVHTSRPTLSHNLQRGNYTSQSSNTRLCWAAASSQMSNALWVHTYIALRLVS